MTIMTGLASVILSLCGLGLLPAQDKASVSKTLVSGYNDFACALHAHRAIRSGNRLCAPVSVIRCLDLVLAGAQGPTRDEILAALGYPLPSPDPSWGSCCKDASHCHHGTSLGRRILT